MNWKFWSDWLPLSNATANVEFWETDLKYAMDWLLIMRQMNGTSSGFKKQLNLAIKDVEHSKKQLFKARDKLEESKKLEEQ